MGHEARLAEELNAHGLKAQGRMDQFLDSCGWNGAQQAFLPGDFSSRTYARLDRGAGDPPRALVMFMPEQEHLAAFLRMQALLEAHGARVPVVYAVDISNGMALIEDLGMADLANGITPENEEALYARAVDYLLKIHKSAKAELLVNSQLPHFNAELFSQQAGLFLEIYGSRVLGREFSTEARDGFFAAWNDALAIACSVPNSLLLRDYHAANIMLPGDGNAPQLAAIDFQDGGIGPISYDLVSLLEDARRDIDVAMRARLIGYYCANNPDVSPEAFRTSCAIMAAQRHIRVLAIVVRRWVDKNRDEVADYFRRSWGLLLAHQAEPALNPLFAWLDEHVPARYRAEWKR